MTHLQKLRNEPLLKWVPFTFSKNQLKSPKSPIWGTGSCHIVQNPRYYRTKRVVETENLENVDGDLISGKDNIGKYLSKKKDNIGKFSRATWVQAQTALLEYLHSTRSLQFMDAEYMSKNSPHFLNKLLKRAETESDDIKHSVTRFLRYHPINEFEPFFESIGLKPSECVPLLPRNLMFLNDDKMLLENYHVLCNYCIARDKIGKIYKEAMEVFQYDYGVLMSKLRAYEELGLDQSFLVKIIVSSPTLLIGEINSAFLEVLEKFKIMGFDRCWIKGQLSENDSYNWRQMLGLLCLFSKVGCIEEQLVGLIGKHPQLLFEGSGKLTFSLIGLLVKFGSTKNDLCSMFLQFPQVQIGNFVRNLRQGLIFLKEIEMDAEEIGKIVRLHSLILGSCAIKKSNSLLANLNIGKKRLCGIIIENPQEMKNWVLGSRVKALPNSGEDERSLHQKTEFLLDLGFVNDSNEMKKALKLFRGKGGELQERFDCFVKAGLDRKDVCEMLKTAPQVLNQSKDVIKMKIDVLVNSLGCPVSSLVAFPAYISYTPQRVKLRFSMYKWLKDQGTVGDMLALSTIIACSDKIFVKKFVKHHPKGPQVWQDLRKQIYSE